MIRNEMVKFLQWDVGESHKSSDSSQLEADSNEGELPPQKKKKIHPLKKLLGDKFRASSTTVAGSLVSLEDQAQAELSRYKAESQSPLEHCPLQWWRDHRTIYPLLCRIARKYLCLPGTSVPSESLFSISGIVVNEKRAALDPNCVDQIVFLHDNLDPIHLHYKRMFRKCKCDICVVKQCHCAMCSACELESDTS